MGLNSVITFTAPEDGRYYLSAGAYSDDFTGTYTVSASLTEASTTGTLDELAEYLTDGYWRDQGDRPRSFDTSQSNEITVDITGLDPEGQQLARWAFEAWEMVADIEFVEVRDDAQITFRDNASGPQAYTNTRTSGGEIISATVVVSTGWVNIYGTEIDSYSFSTYVHEIGHALGLGHQGDYNGDAVYGLDETFANDSWQLSIMSYFSQTDNTTTNASYAELVTPMMVDIIAIRALYGAPDSSSSTAGNTLWGDGTTVNSYVADVFDSLAGGDGNGNMLGEPIAATIYDVGGIDTLDLSFSNTDDRIDLRPQQFSDFGGGTGNLGIARGTIIENLLTGSGDDTVTGNGANNQISTNAGNDSVNGATGNDIAWMAAGHDTYSDEGIGSDTVYGGNGNDTVYANGGDDEVYGGDGNDVLYGGDGGDSIVGGNQGDRIYAGNGNDTVDGGNGRDSAWLGNGNDNYTDTSQGGWIGGDAVYAGNGNDSVSTGGGDDTAFGGSGDDTLAGDNGNDIIDGGLNFDTIYAGGGNDSATGGEGRDSAWLGEGNDTWTDSAQTGWWGGDRVFAGSGNDEIEMFGGNDTATGGAGADSFIFAGQIEQDVITDFNVAEDEIVIDGALWAGGAQLDGGAIASQFGQVTAQGVLLDFGNGNSILLEGLTTLNGLGAAIEPDYTAIA
ncbi:M10 family metallopeptidase C-terminal domain-containing protein [Salipiger aestuarii]|uniref:M10 family metallopeptidase C-terminal domain-containing protein n=1 Tax=Salipiger aestuarii TaxID=568098 RepID=UPI00123B520A|nr:M10 family metallopeptidase C-terminal domain-containing protein [Salipiger aestuarii]